MRSGQVAGQGPEAGMLVPGLVCLLFARAH